MPMRTIRPMAEATKAPIIEKPELFVKTGIIDLTVQIFLNVIPLRKPALAKAGAGISRKTQTKLV